METHLLGQNLPKISEMKESTGPTLTTPFRNVQNLSSIISLTTKCLPLSSTENVGQVERQSILMISTELPVNVGTTSEKSTLFMHMSFTKVRNNVIKHFPGNEYTFLNYGLKKGS